MEKYTLQEGHRFIDLDKDYEDIKLAFVSKYNGDDDPNQVYISWYNYPDEPTKIKIEKYNGRAFPDLYSPSHILTDYYSELRHKITAAHQNFINELYKTPKHKISVKDALTKLKDLASINEEEATAILKLDIAKGELKYLKQKSGNFLVLAPIYAEIEDKKRFLSTIVEELKSKSDRVGLIIKHHQTSGNYRERLLISILKKYLPKKYHIATGFIDGHSKQIDIIIYDQLNYIPLFREDDLVVVNPHSVRATIEVKTTLDPSSLWDALKGIHQVFKSSTHPIPVFKGVFAFESNYETTKGVVNRTKDFYNDSSNSYYSMQLNDIVDSICVPDKHIVFSNYVRKNHIHFKESVSPALYSFENQRDISVEAASFFSDLFAHLDVDRQAKKINLAHFEMLGHEIEYSFEGFIHENWVPQSSFRNEHKFTQETIEARLEDISKWIKGKVTSDSLYEKYFGHMED